MWSESLVPLLESPNFSSFADDGCSEDLCIISAKVELLEKFDEVLEVRRDEEYAIGSLQVRCGDDGEVRSERGNWAVLEVEEVLDLHFEAVNRCAIVKSTRQFMPNNFFGLSQTAFKGFAR